MANGWLVAEWDWVDEEKTDEMGLMGSFADELTSVEETCEVSHYDRRLFRRAQRDLVSRDSMCM